MGRLDRFTPPGMGSRGLRSWILRVLIFSTVFSMGFLLSYFRELNELKRQLESPVYAAEVMTRFQDLIVFPMMTFRLAPAVPLLYIPRCYLYYYQEAKSIFLMKRLRSPWEIHLRCMVLPIAGAMLLVFAGAAVYGFYYLIYQYCTPESLLPVIL